MAVRDTKPWTLKGIDQKVRERATRWARFVVPLPSRATALRQLIVRALEAEKVLAPEKKAPKCGK